MNKSRVKKLIEKCVYIVFYCRFNAVLKFYQFQPKGLAPGEQPNPKDFFPLWVPFCTDFKILWRSEQEKLLKEKYVLSVIL